VTAQSERFAPAAMKKRQPGGFLLFFRGKMDLSKPFSREPAMRFQIASDLHLEFYQSGMPGYRMIEPAPGADALLLPGDIASGVQAVELFADWPVPVLYVPGNHEFYGFEREALLARMRDRARGTAVRVLDRDVAEVGGVRVLGATLWTDYALFEGQISQAMGLAGASLADHSHIKKGFGLFSSRDALEAHRLDRAWLAAELAKAHDGATVVLTHHAPHPGSIHPRFANDLLTAAFVSDCSELLGEAALWAHGHVHNCFDYRVGGTRVVANPRGYCLNRFVFSVEDMTRWENPSFKPGLVAEV
jgi:3',5'-cyclic AMP phosphodiesterase CpdA